jgi:hypothetical protein
VKNIISVDTLGLHFPHQVFEYPLHANSRTSICVCWNEGPLKGNLRHQGISVVSSTFIQYNTVACFFPIKLFSFYYMTP